MSLVGSLEDLGLGDILQIVSLSRKSGLLLLRSEEGEGRIVFFEGLVRAAFVKGEAEDLRGLLTRGGFLDEEAYERAAEAAAAHGDRVTDVLAKLPNLTKERIDSLRREHVERSVFCMFGWTTGEFSFEIRDDVDERDRELMLPNGINAQYLTMEATRLGDEGEKSGEAVDIEFGTIDGPVSPAAARDAAAGGTDVVTEVTDPHSDPFAAAEALALAAVGSDEEPADEEPSDEGPPAAASPDVWTDAALSPPQPAVVADLEAAESQALPAAAAEPLDVAEEVAVAEELDGAEEVATEAAAEVAVEAEPEVAEAVAVEAEPDVAEQVATGGEPAPASAGSLILMDPDLTALEWQKLVLAPLFRRVHIFQRVDGGISRLRQYLRRGEEPIVLVSDSLPGDPVAGFADSAGLIRRLRAHAPRLRVYLVRSGSGTAGRGAELADGCLVRPPDHQLANRRAWPRLEAAGEALRAEIRRGVRRATRTAGRLPEPGVRQPRRRASAERESATMRRLKQMSDRLRDPSARGEVLSLILEYASELFGRVAIFMVRDDEAVGMAQVALERAGGPQDEEFRAIRIAAAEPAWFRAVLQRREGVRAAPSNEGDRRLALLLGSAVPPEAYVAPIESSHRVVALVYGDNLPGGDPIGETASLEIVLHEAGLALERAVLERALADAAR